MPYRTPPYPPGEEEDLWFRLDEALERAFQDPVWSWGVAWAVVRDSGRFPDVRRAAEALLATLYPAESAA